MHFLCFFPPFLAYHGLSQAAWTGRQRGAQEGECRDPSAYWDIHQNGRMDEGNICFIVVAPRGAQIQVYVLYYVLLYK